MNYLFFIFKDDFLMSVKYDIVVLTSCNIKF